MALLKHRRAWATAGDRRSPSLLSEEVQARQNSGAMLGGEQPEQQQRVLLEWKLGGWAGEREGGQGEGEGAGRQGEEVAAPHGMGARMSLSPPLRNNAGTKPDPQGLLRPE